MNHRLFVPEKVVPDARILLERLTDSRHVAVAKNAQASLDEALLFSVSLGVLVFEKCKDGLRGGQA